MRETVITIALSLILGFSSAAWYAGRVNQQLADSCYCPQDCD